MMRMRPELFEAVLEEALHPGRRRAVAASTTLGIIAWGCAMRRFLGLEHIPITATIGEELVAALNAAGLP